MIGLREQPMADKVLFAWSGGKDSTMALYESMQNGHQICALLTTVTQDYDRISMHGVPTALLEAQGQALGLPIDKVYITKNATNQEYESKMKEKLVEYQSRGISSVVFGDIFLEDLRRYREENLSKLGMKGIFPIWKQNTTDLAQRFIHLGFKAVITCVDSHVLDQRFTGREFDAKFLSELPPTVDPCGENGEFHSFVYDGPIFTNKISHQKGEVVLRDNRFFFCDLIPE